MANNYCESSSRLALTEEQAKKAQEIVDRVLAEFNEDEDDCGFCGQVTVENDGVWICHDESIDPDHVATLVQALVDELEIDEPFVFSWGYTCSKPRLDEFGGGAGVIRRGQPPFMFDAMCTAQEIAEGRNVLLTKKQIDAIRCAHADLQGTMQCHEQADFGQHDWKAHALSIQELEEAFPFLKPAEPEEDGK